MNNATDLVPPKRQHGGGRAGAGRPHWKPLCQRKEASHGAWRSETQDEAWERTRQQVRHYAAIGYPAEVICRLIDPPMRHVDTLRTHFQFELDNGRLIANARVAGTAYVLAVSGREPSMTRFWLRARMGWRDVGECKHPTAPIQFQQIEGDDW